MDQPWITGGKTFPPGGKPSVSCSLARTAMWALCKIPIRRGEFMFNSTTPGSNSKTQMRHLWDVVTVGCKERWSPMKTIFWGTGIKVWTYWPTQPAPNFKEKHQRCGRKEHNTGQWQCWPSPWQPTPVSHQAREGQNHIGPTPDKINE